MKQQEKQRFWSITLWVIIGCAVLLALEIGSGEWIGKKVPGETSSSFQQLAPPLAGRSQEESASIVVARLVDILYAKGFVQFREEFVNNGYGERAEVVQELGQDLLNRALLNGFKEFLEIAGVQDRLRSGGLDSAIQQWAQVLLSYGWMSEFEELIGIARVQDRLRSGGLDNAIQQWAQVLLSRRWVSEFEELIGIAEVQERLRSGELDNAIQQWAQVLLSRRWVSEFKELVAIKNLPHDPSSNNRRFNEQLLRLSIGCWIKTRYSPKQGFDELDHLLAENNIDSFEQLRMDYAELKPIVNRLFLKLIEFEKHVRSHQRNPFYLDSRQVSRGADFEPMVNVISHEGPEKHFVVTTQREFFRSYLRVWQGINTLLYDRGFIEKGTYDSIHFTFGIQVSQQKSLRDSNPLLRKWIHLLSIIYNPRSRIYWMMKARRNTVVEYDYTKSHDNIWGGYDDLFQVRAFSVIAGLQDLDFLAGFADIMSELIQWSDSERREFLEKEIRFLEDLAEEEIEEALGKGALSLPEDMWLWDAIEKLAPVQGEEMFLVGIERRRLILGLLEERWRNIVADLENSDISLPSLESESFLKMAL